MAVFGHTIEEAKKNLSDALVAHFDALQQFGEAEEVIDKLCRLAQQRLSFDEMSNNELFWKATIPAGQHSEVLA